MAPPTTSVALLALLYAELAEPYEGRDLSLLGKIGADFLDRPELRADELALDEAISQHPDKLLPLIEALAPVAPTRAEALLHAFPPDDGPPSARWARSFRLRWAEVELAMDAWRYGGVTMPLSDTDAIAEAAHAAASGQDRLE
jgi:hypothetical protein